MKRRIPIERVERPTFNVQHSTSNGSEEEKDGFLPPQE